MTRSHRLSNSTFLSAMKDPFDLLFETLESRFYTCLVHKYHAYVSRAKDKDFARLNAGLYSWSITSPYDLEVDTLKKTILIIFFDAYRLGRSVKESLQEVRKIKTNENHSLVTDELRLLPMKDEQLIKFFAKHIAYQRFKVFLETETKINTMSLEKMQQMYKRMTFDFTPAASAGNAVMQEEKKAKVRRSKSDNITCLSLEQTAIFISLLKQAKILLKDEMYLSKTQAAEAFELLTGYSKHTLRTDLSNPQMNKENLIAIQNALQVLNKLVQEELKGLNKP